jgi:hypothetical protein
VRSLAHLHTACTRIIIKYADIGMTGAIFRTSPGFFFTLFAFALDRSTNGELRRVHRRKSLRLPAVVVLSVGPQLAIEQALPANAHTAAVGEHVPGTWATQGPTCSRHFHLPGCTRDGERSQIGLGPVADDRRAPETACCHTPTFIVVADGGVRRAL